MEHQLQCHLVSVNYLDDFLFTGISKQDCDYMMNIFLQVCSSIGCPVASEKTEWGTEIITFLGVLLNGHSKHLLIPEDKKNKAV